VVAAFRDGRLPRNLADDREVLDQAVARSVLTIEECNRIIDALDAVDEATRVDDYAPARSTASTGSPRAIAASTSRAR